MKKTYKIILLSSMLAGGEAISSQPQEDDRNESPNRSDSGEVKKKDSISMDEHQAEVNGLLHKPKSKLGQKKDYDKGYVEKTLNKSSFKAMETTQRINEDKVFVENLEKTRSRREETKKRFGIK